jgi:hypothetical protein
MSVGAGISAQRNHAKARTQGRALAARPIVTCGLTWRLSRLQMTQPMRPTNQTIMSKPLPTTLAALAAVFFAQAAVSFGDVVETKSGARLVGSVVSIDAGVVTLDTDYAGKVAIKQSEIAALQTDAPITVRLAGGTTMAGTVASGGGGALSIQGQDGTINTTVDQVATTWAVGAKDPAIAALERNWKYELAAELTGTSGNSEKLSYGVGAKATLESADDKLLFYTAAARTKTNDVESENKLKAGVDYSNYFAPRWTWYIRDEAGFDEIKDIDFYNTAAAGLGFDAISNAPKQKLTLRAGIAYRLENYGDPTADDVESAGLDLGLNHYYKWSQALLTNTLTYIPTFDDFADYRLQHDSNIQFPLSGAWSLRMGVAHDYSANPPAGVDKLDTTYYSKFVLSWQ